MSNYQGHSLSNGGAYTISETAGRRMKMWRRGPRVATKMSYRQPRTIWVDTTRQRA